MSDSPNETNDPTDPLNPNDSAASDSANENAPTNPSTNPANNPLNNPFASHGGIGRNDPDPRPDHPIVEAMQHQTPVTARVPERVARGVYTTAQIVHDGPKEFVIDFMQGLTRPFMVGARVIVTPATMGEFAAALSINLDNYVKVYGPPPPVPMQKNERRPSVQEIYDNYKLPDELLSGSYANQVLIGHSSGEFFFDFITGFYPHPAVSSRIYLAASQAPRFLTMLKTCIEQYRQRYLNPPPGNL